MSVLDNESMNYAKIRHFAVRPPECYAQIYVDIQAPKTDEYYNWWRIPINGVEQWINKDGPSDINRTTKVVAMAQLSDETDLDPFENGILSTDGVALDNGSNGVSSVRPDLDKYFKGMLVERDEKYNDTAFVKARVYMYDSVLEEYVITHHGYVGGYGATDNSLLRKFWIYDPSDLLRDVPVGVTLKKNPTLRQLGNFIESGTDSTDTDVGFTLVTPFNSAGVAYRGSDSADVLPREPLDEQDDGGIIDDVLSLFSANTQKSFKRNRTNMIDVINWVANRLNATWYFQPKNGGIRLVFRTDRTNNEYGSTFVDSSIADDSVDEEIIVSTKENNALSDIKPINTLAVNGDTVTVLSATGIDDTPFGDFIDRISTENASSLAVEEYPYVKIRHEPLYKAAGKTELGPTNVRTDAESIQQAESDAVDEFMEHIEETSEGRIELFGDPFVRPYDFVRTVPACFGDQIGDAQEITYSVNDVHHKKYVGSPFVTELGVHAAVSTDDIDTIVKEQRRAQ